MTRAPIMNDDILIGACFELSRGVGEFLRGHRTQRRHWWQVGAAVPDGSGITPPAPEMGCPPASNMTRSSRPTVHREAKLKLHWACEPLVRTMTDSHWTAAGPTSRLRRQRARRKPAATWLERLGVSFRALLIESRCAVRPGSDDLDHRVLVIANKSFRPEAVRISSVISLRGDQGKVARIQFPRLWLSCVLPEIVSRSGDIVDRVSTPHTSSFGAPGRYRGPPGEERGWVGFLLGIKDLRLLTRTPFAKYWRNASSER